MHSLEEVICHLRESLKLGNGICKYFKYPDELLESMIDVSNMIGMKQVKDIVSMMVCRNVVDIYDGKKEENNSDFMDHILILGKPGCGKTTIAHMISRVVCSIGFLDEKEAKPQNQQAIAGLLLQKISEQIADKDIEEKINGINQSMSTCNSFMDDAGVVLNKIKKTIEPRDKVMDGRKISKRLNVTKVKEEVDELENIINSMRQIIDNNVHLSNTEDDIISVSISPDEPTKFENKIVVASRDKLVGGFVGQTAIKVNNKVEEAFGGVLFIDEAYNMKNGDSGSIEGFSAEAISTLCGCMSKYNRNFVLIMAGYEKETISMLESNPGMRRRFGYVITVDDYSPEEVSNIFSIQLDKKKLALDPSVNLTEFIRNNIDLLGSNGSKTNQLSGIVELELASRRYDLIRTGTTSTLSVTDDILCKSIEVLRNNMKPFSAKEEYPLSMYH